MIGEITDAVLQECKALLSDTGAQVMLKTNFLPSKLPDNNGNFILLHVDGKGEDCQYPGGLTRMDWQYWFNSYNYEPDAYVDDDSGFSTDLLNFVDIIRVHFSLGALGKTGWLTPAMGDIFDTYGFQFTLTGITPADAVDQNGLIMGFKVGFDSTAFDSETNFTFLDKPLLTVAQVNNPPFDGSDVIS